MDNRGLQEALREIIRRGKGDPEADGLMATPDRYLRFLDEFTNPDEVNYTTFAGEGYDEMIVQTGITFYSLCEHHLVPFFGTGTIAYIPLGRIIGLSKLARCLDWHSRQLQNQERITMQVARTLEETLSPKGVAVTLTARHLCMEMRGIEKPGATTTTSCLLGAFRERPATRAEFLQLTRP